MTTPLDGAAAPGGAAAGPTPDAATDATTGAAPALPAVGPAGTGGAADPADLARQAAVVLAERTGVARHETALVLGSGWAGAADLLGETVAEVPAQEVPGFAAAVVAGHGGTVRSVRIAGTDRHALVLPRSHYYEARDVRAVAHGVRVAAAAGAHAVVLTNGCGGLDPAWAPGTPVLISDHINLTGASPLEGATFVDLTDLYSPRLRALARTVDPGLPEGVYVQFPGPHYETPAEVEMARRLGGHLVGMSTTLEAIAARHAGLEVLGISLVTNPAAGISPTPLDHAEVLAAGRAAGPRIARLLAEIVRRF
ncbi:purine-nucleoside phosphorylase [Georgenia sp. TF02-10]|uniref:purine-nucleoside phosphorylase n=1 Tax=Georgenia sp. TF02-10 TaxID=2917725 RepID=UPI001FA769D5|nr:purine-nucleoside phosphorylase [Georgenia sp. TF02-10]UNX54189.1 purine-nucleoside phosphorylase [Georgenia sp. TF02-10]